MSFVVLNPNTSVEMTDAVVARLRPLMPASAVLHGMTARQGCPVIDSRETFDIGGRTAIEMLAEVPDAADAILLACFGDPGLLQMRALTSTPVVGLAEAAIVEAAARAERFGILTAGRAWVPMLQECVSGYGAADRLTGVYALDANGAALRRDPSAFADQIARLAARAREEGAQALILGGAAFAGLDFDLPPGLVTIDAFAAAARRLMAIGTRA
ncbi:aspartate/glutamate racemase family protein [Xylophilus sp. GOD-11R]|uniref:aspartate/glutamate racemase family protein n=1 Tax=Xylophilus sp. GOD-11R TaxID=3089814 RepID=UPI00298D2A3B|nr:aspartate/glutamate racemase family protein [Xylophilus sp. GOD-11R]WPB55301.1 aspartate/glutamate racemase family protein [Xylophilus sp. GOD-11R]